MPTLKIEWTWTTESALHLGSGISQAGRADALVQRDPNSQPAIVGEAVKGAVRMGAEHVAAWLKVPQRYPDDAPVEPVSRPFAVLFGDVCGGRFTPGELAKGTPKVEPLLVAMTAITPETGTADDKTLRTVETWPAGLSFTASFTASVPEPELQPTSTLFLAALAAAESLGGRAGVGWGSVKLLNSVKVLVDGTERGTPDQGAMEKALEDLAALLVPIHATAPVVPAVAAHKLSEPTWYQIDLTLLEPACFPSDPAVSNEIITENGVRASALRGALGAHWSRTGLGDKVRQRLSQFTRWSPGFPIVKVGGVESFCAPMPRSFLKPKRLGAGLYDGFAIAADESSIPMKAAGAGWVRPTSTGPVALSEERSARMHVARDYSSGAKRVGALFAQESILPGGHYRAWAQLEKGLFPGKDSGFEIALGRRTSAGNGRAQVRVTELTVDDRPKLFDASASDLERAQGVDVSLQLLSPAIVRDEFGHPRGRLDAKWWIGELSEELRSHVDSNGSATRVGSGRRGGWMSTWRQPRAPIVTIEAGSVWRLRCRDAAAALAVRDWLREHCLQIGDRRHEGFGWVAVDPPWLSGQMAASPSLRTDKQTAPDPPESSEPPRPWPGAVGQHVELVKIYRQLTKPECQIGPQLEMPVRELARELATALTPGNGARAAKDLFDRKTESRDLGKGKKKTPTARWKALLDWEGEHKVLTPRWSDGILLAFGLEAMLVLATPERED